MKTSRLLLAAALATACGYASLATAGTDTANMAVQIAIQDSCDVHAVAPTTMDFGTQGPLMANVDLSSTITVTCTDQASYEIGLDGGGSGNINARVMTLGTDSVSYQLYSDSTRNTVWGNTQSSDTVAGTGTGSAQTLTVYGRVPPQSTPPAGTYTDTVVVTAYY